MPNKTLRIERLEKLTQNLKSQETIDLTGKSVGEILELLNQRLAESKKNSPPISDENIMDLMKERLHRNQMINRSRRHAVRIH